MASTYTLKQAIGEYGYEPVHTLSTGAQILVLTDDSDPRDPDFRVAFAGGQFTDSPNEVTAGWHSFLQIEKVQRRRDWRKDDTTQAVQFGLKINVREMSPSEAREMVEALTFLADYVADLNARLLNEFAMNEELYAQREKQWNDAERKQGEKDALIELRLKYPELTLEGRLAIVETEDGYTSIDLRRVTKDHRLVWDGHARTITDAKNHLKTNGGGTFVKNGVATKVRAGEVKAKVEYPMCSARSCTNPGKFDLGHGAHVCGRHLIVDWADLYNVADPKAEMPSQIAAGILRKVTGEKGTYFGCYSMQWAVSRSRWSYGGYTALAPLVAEIAKEQAKKADGPVAVAPIIEQVIREQLAAKKVEVTA